jgi:hypothetical protein
VDVEHVRICTDLRKFAPAYESGSRREVTHPDRFDQENGDDEPTGISRAAMRIVPTNAAYNQIVPRFVT